jgi:hypothetical protein
VQRQLPQFVAVQGKDVEGVELDLVVVLPTIQAIKVGDPVHSKKHGLTIKDKLLSPDPPSRLDDQWIAACPVVTIAGVQPDPVTIARDDEPEAVVLDLMYPIWVSGNFGPAGRDARCVGRLGILNSEIGLLCNATKNAARVSAVRQAAVSSSLPPQPRPVGSFACRLYEPQLRAA